MRILVLAYHISNKSGGSGRFMWCVTKTLTSMGHDVTLSSTPEEHVDGEFDLILCSHFLPYILDNPAPKVIISHGIVKDESFFPGADKYVSISPEVQKHNLENSFYSEVIPQPIEIVERISVNDVLEKILVIRGHKNEPCPFAFLKETYDLRYSDPDIPIEGQISWADLCITLGRGALESMAQGKPVLVADNRSYMGAIGDGYVNRENIAEIAKCNFSGRRHSMPITREWVESELSKYHSYDSEFLFSYVTENHEAEEIMHRYLSLIDQPDVTTTKGLTSVVIPVYNQHDYSQECIQAVMENTTDYEIVVVDNGSEPPFQPLFSGFNELRLIRNEENRGFPVAINQGIREARGETVVLLNNDVVTTPGSLNRLESWLESFDIVAPVTNYCAGIQEIKLPVYQSREELDECARVRLEENEDEGVKVNWVIGFCMAFRRSLYDELGQFDESLWPCSGEEIDFCFRAKEAGHSIGIALDTYVHHEGSLTFKDLQEDGVVKYKEVCNRSDRLLEHKWGRGFWHNQVTSEDVRLNLGCGAHPIQGFINIDQASGVRPDVVADVMDLSYGEGTVDEIYCGHLLEHFTYIEGKNALRYWISLLKPGGVMSVTVPDFDFLAWKHLENPTAESLIEFNETYIYSYTQDSKHKYCYNGGLLKKVMEDVGFVNLEKLPIDFQYFVDPVPWQVGFKGERKG